MRNTLLKSKFRTFPPEVALKNVQAALRQRFIDSDPVAQRIVLGYTTGQNIIFWGLRGRGKSTMVETALEALGLLEKTFMMGFSPSTNEQRLFGGIDLAAFFGQHQLIYNSENSFMNFPVFVAEEMLDAQDDVVAALKDVLSRRKLINGTQVVDSQTIFTIACTNQNPYEFAKRSESNAALIDRFPIIHRVDLKRFDEKTYQRVILKMFPKQRKIAKVVARLCVTCGSEENPISPRAACDATLKILGARLMGARKFVAANDFLLLIEEGGDWGELSKDVIDAVLRSHAPEAIIAEIEIKASNLESRLFRFDSELQGGAVFNADKYLRLASDAQEALDTFNGLTVSDAMKSRVSEVRGRLNNVMGTAAKKRR